MQRRRGFWPLQRTPLSPLAELGEADGRWQAGQDFLHGSFKRLKCYEIMNRGEATDYSKASPVHRHRKLEAPNHPGAADR